MNRIIAILICLLFLIGCAGQRQPQVVYYDIEGINHIPGGVSAGLLRPGIVGKREIVAIIGTFSQSSIEIASQVILNEPLIVEWYDTNQVDHTRPFPFHILPPLDTANQKYHIRFTFYPNDSVKIQARAVAKSDCRHTIDHGATALSAGGPCVSDRGYYKLLHALNNNLVPEPGPYKFPDD